MAEPVPADICSLKSLPPCPGCGNGSWQTFSGGDAANDPYPDGR
jgi:hypothetical protein